VQSMGLWQVCTTDLHMCASTTQMSGNPGWLKAVRALECIAMFFAVAAIMIGFYSNCVIKTRLHADVFNKNMETSTVVSVIFGVFGLIIFASQIHGLHRGVRSDISWGFVLVCLANTLLGVGAFLMLISHRIRLIALQDHFAHQHLDNSFHTRVDFPDYTSEGHNGFAYTANTHPQMSPPPYETVVNCSAEDEASPPPYSEVVKSDG